jgi:type II secretory pathway predicted ATPase ExeA
MTAMHPITPIIRTGAYSILRDVSRAALETARLGIVRGPVGIGKTYALRQVADELSQGDDDVILIEAPADKSAAVRRFYLSALCDIGVYGHGGADPFDVFTGYMLRSFPFRRHGQRKRILLIVDECQRLAPNLLETLRYAYDAGQLARDGLTDQPAFGILLVGNHDFLAKGWRSFGGRLHALLSRCAVNIDLSRPDQSEYRALAEQLFPDSDTLRSALAKHGAKRGNLREMAEAHALAMHYAGGGPISPIHLEKAILFSSGVM